MHHHAGFGGHLRAGPWFGRHPALAVGVAVMLFASVVALRLAVQGAEDAILLLFVLPIALLAVAFGVRAGALGGGAGVLLLGVWAGLTDVSLTPLGWLSRATPMLLLGLLVGAASDRLRQTAEAERRLAVAEERAREAAEINDSIIQRPVAVKWSMETGGGEGSIELLTESIQVAEALVAGLLQGQDNRTMSRTAVGARLQGRTRR